MNSGVVSQHQKNQLLAKPLDMADFPLKHTLHSLFEHQAALCPDATAIIGGDKSMTYQQLNQYANRVARQLGKYKLEPEAMVAICIDRSVEMVVMVIAVLKAGLAYVPIDPLYPKERIQFMLSDTKAKVIISTTANVHLFDDSESEVVLEDELMADSEGGRECNLNLHVSGPNLAVIIYTSGSSGKPKGVMIEHEAYINRLYWRQNIHPLGVGERVLQMTSFSFGPSVAELFIPLICGATCVLMSKHGGKHSDEIVDTIVKHQICAVIMVPSLLSTLLKNHTLVKCKDVLRYVYSGGEVVTKQTVNHFVEQLPHTGLHEVYGQTETVITHHWDHTTAGEKRAFGHALQNKEIYVLDENQEPVKTGEIGEIYSAGVGVSRGYLNRPDLTHSQFIDNPYSKFSNPAYRRMYATGDLAKLNENGAIDLCGRADDQVKLRGFRIEIGEVESVAYSHPKVEQAVGKVVNQQLIMYYSLLKGLDATALGVNELVTYMAVDLPKYMLPNRFIQMDDFPLLPNGKIDRKLLPMPGRVRPNLSYAYQEPVGEAERMLCHMWQDILDIDSIGAKDSFFDLGGDSLGAVNFVRACEKQQLPITYELFYKGPTIAELAKHAAGRVATSDRHTLKALDFEVAALASEIPGIEPQQSEPTQYNVLLTGATGFVGAHLLHYLLTQDDCEVTCIVRGENARSRLLANLEALSLDIGDGKQRLVVLTGDLTKARFGLSHEQYEQLYSQVDCIYHNGAWVNHIYPYTLLKDCNVMSTLAVIQFAASETPKQIRYMSTMALAGRAQGEFPFRTGYTETKYVSENLVLHAGLMGLPVTSYRMGMVSGNTQTGCSNDSDIVALFLRACIDVKCMPNFDCIGEFMPPNLIPVNELAKTMVEYESSGLGVIKTVDSKLRVDWSLFHQGLVKRGCLVEMVTFEQWHMRIIESSVQMPNSYLDAVILAVVQRRAYNAQAVEESDIGTELDSDVAMDSQTVERLLNFYFEHADFG